jgi:hypothetical protein
MNYNHPNYLVHREAVKEPHSGAITAAAATGGLVGSTFRTFTKCVVFGVAAICSAAGSGGTGKIVVARVQGVGGTVSLTSYTLSNATLAANAQTSMVFSSPLTLDSYGDAVLLHGSASAATDIAELGAVIWRYRLLPNADQDLNNTVAG